MSTDGYRHVVTPQKPGPAVPDGDGGSTSSWIDLAPATWHCSIEPASARDLERVAAGTVLSTASYIVKGRYRSDITTQARLLHHGRQFSVTGVSDPEERHVQLVLVCVEVVL